MNNEPIVTIPFRTFHKGMMFYSMVLFAMALANFIMIWGTAGEGVRISKELFWICFRVESLMILGAGIICAVMNTLNVEISDFQNRNDRTGDWLSPHMCMLINQIVTYVAFVELLVVDWLAFWTVSMTLEIYVLGFVSVNVIFLINNGHVLFSKVFIQRTILNSKEYR